MVFEWVCRFLKWSRRMQTFSQWCEGDVMVQELPPLHHQEVVVVAGIVNVRYDRGAHGPGWWKQNLFKPRAVCAVDCNRTPWHGNTWKSVINHICLKKICTLPFISPSSYSGGRILRNAVLAWPHWGCLKLLHDPSMVLKFPLIPLRWREQSWFIFLSASSPQEVNSSASTSSLVLGKFTLDAPLSVFSRFVPLVEKVGRAKVPWSLLRLKLWDRDNA